MPRIRFKLRAQPFSLLSLFFLSSFPPSLPPSPSQHFLLHGLNVSVSLSGDALSRDLAHTGPPFCCWGRERVRERRLCWCFLDEKTPTQPRGAQAWMVPQCWSALRVQLIQQVKQHIIYMCRERIREREREGGRERERAEERSRESELRAVSSLSLSLSLSIAMRTRMCM